MTNTDKRGRVSGSAPAAGSANLDCDIENCFKNFFGVCFVAGDLGYEKCDKYTGDDVSQNVECEDCGVMFVSDFENDGLCPLCAGLME